MELNCIYLHLNPLPHELKADATKCFDALLPGLVQLLDTYPSAKLNLAISGFALDKLILRKRNAALEQLQRHSSQIEILSFPHYDPAPELITPRRVIEQLQLQKSFWKQFSLTPSSSSGVYFGKNSPDFFSALKQAGIKHVIVNSENMQGRAALCCDDSGLMCSPAHPLYFGPLTTKSPNIERFSLTEKVQLRSVVLTLTGFTEDYSQTFLAALKSLLSRSNQQYLFASEVSYMGSPSEQAVLAPWFPTASSGLSRMTAFWNRYEEVPALLESRIEKAKKSGDRGERHGPSERLLQAQMYLHQASSRALYLTDDPKAERAMTELALCGEVELEAYLRPDVDPTVGWVEKHSLPEYEFVSTQLADYIIDRGGRVIGVDYKPRKISICSSTLLPSFDLSFSVPVQTPPTSAVQSALTRKTKDICSIRFEDTKLSDLGPMSVFRELTFRAGIGAHLPNATTGFSFEYWLTGDLSEDFMVTVSFSFALPSPNSEAGFIKPLLCVGGVSEKRYYLERGKKVNLSELTGGGYGIRIIDTVEDFMMDVRSAKQLEEMEISPQFLNGVFIGSICKLSVRASRIFDDDRSNTIFVSIM